MLSIPNGSAFLFEQKLGSGLDNGIFTFRYPDLTPQQVSVAESDEEKLFAFIRSFSQEKNLTLHEPGDDGC